MTEVLTKALDIIIKIAEPDKVILFGSRARGDSTPDSDYDLLILKKGIKKARKLSQKLHFNFIGISAPFDILVYDFLKYDEKKNFPNLIYYEIEREGILLYEK